MYLEVKFHDVYKCIRMTTIGHRWRASMDSSEWFLYCLCRHETILYKTWGKKEWQPLLLCVLETSLPVRVTNLLMPEQNQVGQA